MAKRQVISAAGVGSRVEVWCGYWRMEAVGVHGDLAGVKYQWVAFDQEPFALTPELMDRMERKARRAIRCPF